MTALTVPTANHLSETGRAERRGERAEVVQELVAPASKSAVDAECTQDLLLLSEDAPVMRGPYPVEIWGGEAEHSFVAQNAPAFFQQDGGVAVMQMLDEVLGKDEGDVLVRQAGGNVEDLVDTGIIDAVEIDPAVDVIRAGTDMKTHAGLYDDTVRFSILDFGFWI